MRRWLFLALFALVSPVFAATPAVEPLSAADVPALLKPPAHGARILSIWALDCAYCEANMQVAAQAARAAPKRIQLVTVATDRIALHAQIAARLAAAHMGDFPARAYTEAAPERINFLIDPNWGGETPRTIVIRASGHREGVSGELTAERLRKLLATGR